MFALLPLFALSACSSVKEVHRLDRKLALQPMEGIRLDLVYASPRVAEIAGRNLIVEVEPVRSMIAPGSHIPEYRDMDRFRNTFEMKLAQMMWQTGVFNDVGQRTDNPPLPKPNLRLRMTVTEWREGSTFLRVLLSTGLGATRVQTEGAFIDPETGYVFAAFVDARAHPGGRPYDPKTWRSQTLITQDIFGTIQAIQRFAVKVTGKSIPIGGFEAVSDARPSRVDTKLTPEQIDKLYPKPKPTIAN